ncbi:T-cell-interacting, activating receptor on myeloid cells protein 1-like isoform X2 [Hemicordylus capensis]|uniref:T-cell-interacting, activating receptor on myeloid cells protein 1-like isoform X2 n=2 Tax=Hemicordylus capensis TaxID=884348 RepID=UPI002303C6BD|nr:T-cell-interacting, activating receptor on myeloid cells protein 1-like isoform X2 [Hemicordylus capensis]
MRFSFKIPFLGWWLTGQWWMCESYPKPSISVNPSGAVTLGGNVTIHCKSKGYQQMEFYLQKAASSYVDTLSTKVAEEEEAIFPISHAKQSDAGIYWCRYCAKAFCEQQWSDSSDRLYINVTDPSLPKPFIKVRPRGQSPPGVNVTIECQGPENAMNFFLHKSNNLIASQMVGPARDTANFSFTMERLEDAGSYSCQYRLRGSPFVWSKPSDPVELLLRATSSAKTNICLGVSGLVLLALVLIVAEAM